MAGGLSSDEIEKMRKEAEINAAADAERQEVLRFCFFSVAISEFIPFVRSDLQSS